MREIYSGQTLGKDHDASPTGSAEVVMCVPNPPEYAEPPGAKAGRFTSRLRRDLMIEEQDQEGPLPAPPAAGAGPSRPHLRFHDIRTALPVDTAGVDDQPGVFGDERIVHRRVIGGDEDDVH